MSGAFFVQIKTYKAQPILAKLRLEIDYRLDQAKKIVMSNG